MVLQRVELLAGLLAEYWAVSLADKMVECWADSRAGNLAVRSVVWWAAKRVDKWVVHLVVRWVDAMVRWKVDKMAGYSVGVMVERWVATRVESRAALWAVLWAGWRAETKVV